MRNHKEKKNAVIFIFGMGKSGTSLVAQLVHEITGFKDEDLIAGRMDNVFGYYENKDVVDINNKILEASDITWPVKREITNKTNFSFPGSETLVKKLLAKLLKNNSTLVFKDPRLTVCLPFWLRHTQEFKQYFIFVFRHPTEVALSLSKATGYDHKDALLSWKINNDLSIELMKGKHVLFINYNELMSKPREEILRLYNYLGIKPKQDVFARQLFNTVPEIRHFKYDKDFSDLPADVKALYLKLISDHKDNKTVFTSVKGFKAKELSEGEKVAMLRERIKTLDKLIRKQYEEMNELSKEYHRLEQSNQYLAEENRKIYAMLREAVKQK